MTTATSPAVPDEFDFDALLAERRLAPQPFRLGGREYQVRRDLTAQERIEADRLLIGTPGRDGDVEGTAILLGYPGEDGAYDTAAATAFVAAAAALPHDVEPEVWARVLIAARLASRRPDSTQEGDSDPGESTAS